MESRERLTKGGVLRGGRARLLLILPRLCGGEGGGGGAGGGGGWRAAGRRRAGFARRAAVKVCRPPESRVNEPPVGRPAGHTEYLTDTHHQLFGQSTLSPPPTDPLPRPLASNTTM